MYSIIFNFSRKLLSVYLLTALYILSSILLSKINEGLFYTDSMFRGDFNNFVYDGLMVYWTNISYLYLFLPLVVLVLLQNLFVSTYINVAYIMLLLYFVTALVDFQAYSYLSSNTNLCYDQLTHYNILLLNSLNKYHPLMLYLSWAYVVLHAKKLISNNWINNYNYQTAFANFYSYITIILLTLSLGGWWAYQEGSWGGWWNWDPSEVFGLAIMLTILTVHHLVYYSLSYYRYFTLLIYMLAWLLLYYVFMQLNFELISHNFGLRNTDSVDVRIVFSLMSLLSLLLISKTVISYWKLYEKVKGFSNVVLASLLNYASKIFILSSLLLSVTILINDLLWKSFAINLVNVSPDYYYLLFTIVYIMSVTSFRFSVFNILTLSISFALTDLITLVIVYLFMLYNSTTYFKLHLFILTSITLNVIIVKVDFTSWHFLTHNLFDYINFTQSLQSSTPSSTNFTQNFPFITSCDSVSYTTDMLSNSMSVMYNDSTTDIRKFVLSDSTNCTLQALVSDSLNYSFSSNFSNLAYALVSILLLTLILLILRQSIKKEVIIF